MYSLDVSAVVFLCVMGLMLICSLIIPILILRYAQKEERKQRRKEEEWTRAISLLGNVRFGPMPIARIEESSQETVAKVTWFDKGKISAQLPKKLFYFETEENHKAPTVEFVFDGAGLLLSGLVPENVTEEQVKKLPLKDWISPASIVKVIVRASSIYEPFSLKKVSTAVFEQVPAKQDKPAEHENEPREEK